MVPSMNIFMDAMEKWISAVRSDDFATARFHAENIVRNGELLTLRPEFRACFARHYPELEPKEALLCFCRFLVCATDGRAHVLKHWVDRNQPSQTERPTEPPPLGSS